MLSPGHRVAFFTHEYIAVQIIARLSLLKIPARRGGSSSEIPPPAVKLLEFRVPCLWRVTFLCRVDKVTADDLIPMYVWEALVGLKYVL